MPSTTTRGTALTHQEYAATRRLRALDGIRAVAVLLVVSWHVRDGAFSALNGDSGVVVFFVLSGFLITTLAQREEAVRGRFRYGAFLVRRAFRILPLLWLGVVVYAVAVFVLHFDPRSHAFARAIPYDLLYLPEVPVFSAPPTWDLGEGPVPFAGVWSLGIEEKFYLVWPLLAFVLLARRRNRGALAALLAVGLWTFTAVGPHTPVRYLTHYAPLLLGCVLALALAAPRSYRVVAALTRPAVAVPAFLMSIVVNLVRWDTHGAVAIFGRVGLQLLVTLMIAAVVVRPTSRGARALSGRMIAHVGVLSYALYLFHNLALEAVDRVLPVGGGVPLALVSVTAGLALSLIACEVLHRLVERPCQEIGRRLAARVGDQPQPRTGTVEGLDPSAALAAPGVGMKAGVTS